MAAESTGKPRARKSASRPKKPYPAFPLSPHASGKWQKKIRGRTHYFGRWATQVNGKLVRIDGDGWREALECYKQQADDLHAGRTPRQAHSAIPSLAVLCEEFLNAKLRKLQAGELSPRSFAELKGTTDRLIEEFGGSRLLDDLNADDFGRLRASIAKKWGPMRLGNEIVRTRSVFKFGFESGLIDKPMRYGPQFVKPSKSTLRRHRATTGPRLFSAEELRLMLDALQGNPVVVEGNDKPVVIRRNPQLRAMVLLGVNCGFGNVDCAALPQSLVDWDGGWISYARPKTGIDRKAKLWPETLDALREAIAVRPRPKDAADTGLCFLTAQGSPWVRFTPKQDDSHEFSRRDNVSLAFQSLLKRLGLSGRTGLGFYALRHTLRTVADEVRDTPAIRVVMGHADHGIDDLYRERIADERLEAIAAHVRAWLWPEGGAK